MQIAEHFVGILAMGVIQTILWVNATAALEAIAKRWARAAPAPPPGGPIGDASAGRSLCGTGVPQSDQIA